MTSQTGTSSAERVNPLKKCSKELFKHGQDHGSQNSSFDRLVAGIHIDNALELFLKFYGAHCNIRNYKNLQVPALLTELEPHIPELAEFGGDLRTLHDIRDGAYHMGQSLDEYNLNWGIMLVKSFFSQVELRETKTTRTLPNGGGPHSTYSEAEQELKIAIRLFEELTPRSERAKFEEVLIHIFKSVELWLDNKLKESMTEKISHREGFREEEISRLSFDKKTEILEKERIVEDPVLLRELSEIRQLRNTVVHFKDRPVLLTLSNVYKYLQIAMHFIKVKSPSAYEGRTAEDLTRRILEKHNVAYRKDVVIQGYSLKSRFDFAIDKNDFIIEVRHSRVPSGISIFTESLAFRIVDLKKMDERWKFILVLSGQWSKRSRDILQKYCDYVVRIEDFEDFLISHIV